MDERERRRQELLDELERRFKSSAETMRIIATRIGEAAKMHNTNAKRSERASRRLRECVGSDLSSIPFTYLEYLEFTSADEFEKFRSQPIITDHDIHSINWDELSRNLVK